mmetsp:Transcript_19904/g.67426  ORF Transcript_19904/g.67426 Transcript_19904/m.67426 type:complete len:259 (+) Transcript_19904:663-1439(+)
MAERLREPPYLDHEHLADVSGFHGQERHHLLNDPAEMQAVPLRIERRLHLLAQLLARDEGAVLVPEEQPQQAVRANVGHEDEDAAPRGYPCKATVVCSETNLRLLAERLHEGIERANGNLLHLVEHNHRRAPAMGDVVPHPTLQICVDHGAVEVQLLGKVLPSQKQEAQWPLHARVPRAGAASEDGLRDAVRRLGLAHPRRAREGEGERCGEAGVGAELPRGHGLADHTHGLVLRADLPPQLSRDGGSGMRHVGTRIN